MRRILSLAALALTLTGGVALADRRGDHRGGGDRDHRQSEPARRTWGGGHDRDRDRGERWGGRRDERRTVRVERTRPVFRNGGFYFAGGFHRNYVRPVINVRYRDYYRRPAVIVENYEPVNGYLWMAGQWQWSGYEWQWIPGHYEVDTRYDDTYYNSYDSGYDSGYDPGYDSNYNTAPTTYVTPGVSLSGSVRFGN